jgi:Holliday junction resolvase-like predicted endonuclease
MLPPMRTTMQRRGDAAEDTVAGILSDSGWSVLGRRFRVGRAEIDLLAVDPGPPAQLVVVEVRFRGRRDFGLPEETVDHRKLARLRAAAFNLREAGRLPNGTELPPLPFRIDLVVVEPARPPRHHRHVG